MCVTVCVTVTVTMTVTVCVIVNDSLERWHAGKGGSPWPGSLTDVVYLSTETMQVTQRTGNQSVNTPRLPPQQRTARQVQGTPSLPCEAQTSAVHSITLKY